MNDYNGGVQVISNPNFVRAIDVTGADFDGTDTAGLADTYKTQEQNNSKFNPWNKAGGFTFAPSADGAVDVLTWEDYQRNGKVIDDALKTTVYASLGEWNGARVVKIYTTSAVKTMSIGQII